MVPLFSLLCRHNFHLTVILKGQKKANCVQAGKENVHLVVRQNKWRVLERAHFEIAAVPTNLCLINKKVSAASSSFTKDHVFGWGRVKLLRALL